MANKLVKFLNKEVKKKYGREERYEVNLDDTQIIF